MVLRASLSRAESVADHVERLIAERRLSPGARLGTKATLKEDTGVAVGTIDEALRLLQTRGQVVVHPGPRGGIFVAERDPLVQLGQTLIAVRGEAVSLIDAVAVRDALEPLVAEEAARHRSAADTRALRTRLRAMEAVLDEPTEFLKANWALHVRIAEIGRNEILRDLYRGIAGFIEKKLGDVVPDQAERDYKRTRLEIHADLVDAIADGDVEAARAAADRHALETAIR